MQRRTEICSIRSDHFYYARLLSSTETSSNSCSPLTLSGQSTVIQIAASDKSYGSTRVRGAFTGYHEQGSMSLTAISKLCRGRSCIKQKQCCAIRIVKRWGGSVFGGKLGEKHMSAVMNHVMPKLESLGYISVADSTV